MHTHEFSLQRFGSLLKSELRRNLKDCLFFTGIILGIYLISPINDGVFSTDVFLPYIGIIVFLLPFLLYRNLFHPTKGVAFGMLPASQTEKFLVMFVLCALILPLGMLLFAWLVSLIGVGLTGHADEMFRLLERFTSHERLGFFESDFWGIIGAQSLAIWGTCFFRSKKLGKTLLYALCAVCAVAILFGIYGINHIALWSVEDPVLDRIAWIGSIGISIVLPVALWVWAFLKMRRQQF